MPCDGNLSCTKGKCNAGPANVNFLQATLETTNEDKDDDTHVEIGGLFFWPGDGKTHYDDWSTHLAFLTPSSIPLTELPAHDLFLRATPNGDDSWKLNFIINGVRDDGTHFEFRKDNVWIANEGSSATEIHWNLGAPGLDLIWNDTDANGLPLNPTWRGSPGGKSCLGSSGPECWDLSKVCPFHASPLADDLTDYGRCSSQAPTYDRSWLCGWHANWFPATFDGKIASGGGKNNQLYGYIVYGWGDDDFHVNLSPQDNSVNLARDALVTEFDSDETTDQFLSNWWNGFDNDDRVHGLQDYQARIIGLVGIDTEHGPHGELHPVYVFSVRDPRRLPFLDTWGIFIRNWGNEGACGGSQHYLDLNQFTLRFPAPPGAELATSVQEGVSVDLDAGSENGSDFSSFSRTTLSPLQHDAHGAFAEITFNIGPPEAHTFIDGAIDLIWKCGNDFCPPPPPSKPASPAPPPTSAVNEDEEVLPGVSLLSKDQASQLVKQFPSRPPPAPGPARSIALVPFVKPTPQAPKLGQGALTDRAVPDTARQQRSIEVQKSVCNMLGNDPKRPAICSSLP